MIHKARHQRLWNTLLLLVMTAAITAQAQVSAATPPQWEQEMGAIAVAHQGRTMPIDTLARRTAVELTGRTKWSPDRGPEAFSGRAPIELLCDLLFDSDSLRSRELILIEHRPLKRRLGFDETSRFFSPEQIAASNELREILIDWEDRDANEPKAKPTAVERAAMKTQTALVKFIEFDNGRGLAIAPTDEPEVFLEVSARNPRPGVEPVQEAFIKLGQAYNAGAGQEQAVADLVRAINEFGVVPPETQRAVAMEHFLNGHKPWVMALIATILALLAIVARWITGLRIINVVVALLLAWAIGEQLLGLGLRVIILDRAPVSNTYEALLWIGLVSVIIGIVGQLIRKHSWMLACGLAASVLSLLFAINMPLTDQTNALPPVLRSNYWLTLHVLTIVGSYGAMLLAAALAHAYLIRDVLLRREAEPGDRLIVQVYRMLQIGLVLLTIGTILGGVWAAESWGRFWGWDPKETWSLITIVIYFLLLHARYVGWIRDFGLAVSAIGGFLAVVWTFYGVNYVMATGLHSYGFGSGGERWVALWAIAEIIFIVICRIRYKPTDHHELHTNAQPDEAIADGAGQ